MIKVQNDYAISIRRMLISHSAAFDTIDQDILLSRLCNVHGITGNVLDWFRSYLTVRIQRVVIEECVSVNQELNFGVPPQRRADFTLEHIYMT